MFLFPSSAQDLLARVQSDRPGIAAYDDVVRYFGLAWLTYRNAASSSAAFPGYPSWSGRDCDALEGFSRLMPLFAAWCASGRSSVIEVQGRSFSILDEFRKGLLAGTDPDSPFYWGDMTIPSDQRIVEAADIALSLWLLRDLVWHQLKPNERQQIADWLSQASSKPGLDNNWHLFFVLIDRVLHNLGFPGRIAGVDQRYGRIKEFHLGGGWFCDGKGGRVDYYNAWGFHYALTWIDRIDPAWDPEFISAARRAFLRDFRYLIGPTGFPAFGRSLPYRLAISAPMIAALENDQDIVSPGEARRALDVTWGYFVRKGALSRGTITQGYHASDARLVDPYSGPASPLWSLRSLVMAYYYPPSHAFWTAHPSPLPVEQNDFDICLPAIGWRIHGWRATGEIRLWLRDEENGARDVSFASLSRTDQLRCALGLKSRPKNLEPKYDARSYSSAGLFF